MALSKDGKLPEPKEIVMLAHAEAGAASDRSGKLRDSVLRPIGLERRSLDLVDCGHTGIIHLHGKTGLCEMLHGDNLPLGVREGEIYDQISVPFEPGDLLLFYSDGVTEARNSAGRAVWRGPPDGVVSGSTANSSPTHWWKPSVKPSVTFSESGRLTDDLTSVAIGWRKAKLPIARAEMEIRSDLKELRRAREFVRAFCRDLPGPPLDEDSVGALELAVNEACQQHHEARLSWPRRSVDSPGSRSFPRPCRRSGCITWETRSTRRRSPPPALDGSRESGFGVYIITQSVDEVRYYRDERGRNCIALVKASHRRNGK